MLFYILIYLHYFLNILVFYIFFKIEIMNVKKCQVCANCVMDTADVIFLLMKTESVITVMAFINIYCLTGIGEKKPDLH